METVGLVFESAKQAGEFMTDAEGRGLACDLDRVFTIPADGGGRGLWENRKVNVHLETPGQRVLLEAMVGPLF